MTAPADKPQAGDAWDAWFDGLASALRHRTDPEKPVALPLSVVVPPAREHAPIISFWPDYSAGYYGLEWKTNVDR